MAKVRIRLVKSTIGRSPRQARTVVALGLRKLGHAVTHEDTPQIRGMIDTVSHLVVWENVAE
jgi:large subunit ribosomal protein L30